MKENTNQSSDAIPAIQKVNLELSPLPAFRYPLTPMGVCCQMCMGEYEILKSEAIDDGYSPSCKVNGKPTKITKLRMSFHQIK